MATEELSSTERPHGPSWYLCDHCKEPHTTDEPLVNYAVKGYSSANWNIHDRCSGALRATLVEGLELVRREGR
jgi:hypothetical protein